MKPSEVADIVSALYSASPKNPELAAATLDKLAAIGVDEDDFDSKDDIMSDANEWRETCPLCGEKLGTNAFCERCNQDAADSAVERAIDECTSRRRNNVQGNRNVP
jgi:hypothetical protein